MDFDKNIIAQKNAEKYKDEYNTHILEKRQSILYLGAINTIWVWIACLGLDYIIYPELTTELWTCRAIFIVFTAGCAYAIKFHGSKIGNHLITFLLLFSSSLTIGVMIYLTNESSTPYVMGLVVNSVVLTLVFGIRILEAVFYTILNVALYAGALAFMSDSLESSLPIVVIVHFIFIMHYTLVQVKHNDTNGLLAYALEKMNEEKTELIKQQVGELEKQNKEILESQDIIIQMNKMASIGEMTTMLFHETKNPLNQGIGAHAYYESLVRDNELNQEELTEIMGDIKESFKEIDDISSNLNSFAYAETEKHSIKTDMSAIINSALKMTTDKVNNINVSIYCPNVKVFAAENHLKQVFVNLLTNSIGAFPKGDQNEIGIDVSVNGNDVEIEYRDNGSGVDQAIQNKIFEPYVTTKEKGSGIGMGLKITKTIIENHKGTIEYAGNRPGAVFKITLPIAV